LFTSKLPAKNPLSTLMFSISLMCFSMLLIFCPIVCSFINILLFSFFLTYNSTFNFCSLSKAPYRFWTNMSFSFIIFLFLNFKLRSLSRI
jgi:hypothetical protein